MKTYCTLLRLTVLNRLAYFRSASWKDESGRISWKKLLSLLMLVLLGAGMLAFVIGVEWMMYKLLRTVGHAEMLPTMALIVGMAGMLLMSFFYIMSSLYFSKDSMWMSYLPIRSTTLLSAKLSEIWAGEAALNAVIMLPAFIMYGMHVKAEAALYLRALLIALLSPLLPVAIITLMSTLLARLVKGASNSSIITAGMSMLMVFGIILGEMLVMPSVPDDADLMWFAKLILTSEGLLNAVTRALPPVRWAVKALMGSWSHLALFTAVSLLSIVAVTLALGPGYLSRCRNLAEQGSRKKTVRLGSDSYRARSQLLAMVGLEWKQLVRSSVVLMQCLAGALIYPLMLALFLLGGAINPELGMLGEALNEMSAELSPLDMTLILAAVIGFVTFISPAAPTAISREGRRHAVLRTLPAAPMTALRAKLLVSAAIDLFAVVLTLIVLLLGIRAPWWVFATAALLCIPLRYACLTCMMTLDTVRPVLQWTNETQAVKQNLNVVFGMLVCIAALALPGGAVYLAFRFGAAARFAGVVAVLIAEALLGALLLHRVAVKRYAVLEG